MSPTSDGTLWADLIADIMRERDTYGANIVGLSRDGSVVRI